MGRNWEVKAETGVVSERMKVFYCRKEERSRWEKDQRSTCAAVAAAHTEERREALSHSQLLSNTAIPGMIEHLDTKCIHIPFLMQRL